MWDLTKQSEQTKENRLTERDQKGGLRVGRKRGREILSITLSIEILSIVISHTVTDEF